ncbi:MAG TPA: hypothetical protein VKG92_10760 [Flavobacteriales bacterium]|nr:hypothetical protein [Flavobacteriales bacterium]
MSIVALHITLLAAYTFPDPLVPERVRVIGQAYTRPLFHQQWQLFAPDPPLCCCEVQVLLGDEEPRPLYASDADYLTRRMAGTIAWHVQRELAAGSGIPSAPLRHAMRAMVRDIGREVPDLRFQLVQRCVTDPSRPEVRDTRTTPLEMP